MENVDQYIKLSMEFIFRDGIRRQMDAFRSERNFDESMIGFYSEGF